MSDLETSRTFIMQLMSDFVLDRTVDSLFMSD